MTGEEAIAYYIDNNERIISVAKDENRYNYETQQIKDVFMRRSYEANELAIEALEELKAHREAWEKCVNEIKEWYWNADKQAIAKDPCVIDAMVDLFIRTIKECRPKEGDAE